MVAVFCVHLPQYCLQDRQAAGSVIFVNENQNDEKRENNEFVNEN